MSKLNEINFLSTESVALRSFELLCKAMRIDVKSIEVQDGETPAGIKVGDEIAVLLKYFVVDANSGVAAQEERGTFTLPLEMMGQNERTGDLHFRVPQSVIRFTMVSEQLAVCWGDPAGDGYVVWYSSSDDFVSDHWTTCSDYEDCEPSEERMTFEDSGQTVAMHPEIARNLVKV